MNLYTPVQILPNTVHKLAELVNRYVEGVHVRADFGGARILFPSHAVLLARDKTYPAFWAYNIISLDNSQSEFFESGMVNEWRTAAPGDGQPFPAGGSDDEGAGLLFTGKPTDQHARFRLWLLGVPDGSGSSSPASSAAFPLFPGSAPAERSEPGFGGADQT